MVAMSFAQTVGLKNLRTRISYTSTMNIGTMSHAIALPDHVLIRIVPTKDYDPALSDHLVREFKGRLGDDVHIEVKLVSELEQSKNGKFKWVISQVPIGI